MTGSLGGESCVPVCECVHAPLCPLLNVMSTSYIPYRQSEREIGGWWRAVAYTIRKAVAFVRVNGTGRHAAEKAGPASTKISTLGEKTLRAVEECVVIPVGMGIVRVQDLVDDRLRRAHRVNGHHRSKGVVKATIICLRVCTEDPIAFARR
ncbi:hypothetical protein FRB94_014728 [Tulasnella sp. JGI-2019a]|nr:hypothetical protein FRB94_014728 [Tulasnella sp. JGI-2019a]